MTLDVDYFIPLRTQIHAQNDSKINALFVKNNFGQPGARQGPIVTAFRDRPAAVQLLIIVLAFPQTDQKPKIQFNCSGIHYDGHFSSLTLRWAH